MSKVVYCCGIDYQTEEQFEVFRTISLLKEHKKCWTECGIVRLSLTGVEWIVEQDLRRAKNEFRHRN